MFLSSSTNAILFNAYFLMLLNIILIFTYSNREFGLSNQSLSTNRKLYWFYFRHNLVKNG